MKKHIVMILTGVLVLAFSLSAAADIPMMINYQGYVTDVSGTPIEGNGFLKLAIVNQAGDATYWSNDGTSVDGGEPTNAVEVTVTNGIFSIKLGDKGRANMDVLPATPFDNQEIYIRVWFSENNINFEQLEPDIQVVSAAFAYKAQSVAGGLSWTQLTDIPAGFNDGTDDGITSELDPTVPESLKDGVSWSDLSGIPAGFADGVDDEGEGSGGTESDPVFSASAAANITTTNTSNWNTAYGWGNHASQGYLTSGTGITTVYSGEGTKGYSNAGPVTIEFDCSEVAGSGIDCNGEDINVYSLRGYNLGTQNALFAANDGSIGIGNTSPSQKLHVEGAGRFDLSGTYGRIELSTPGGWPGFIAYSPDNHRRDISFRDSGLSITVASTAGTTPSDSNGIWIMNNGYVGIGTTNPQEELDVIGDLTVSASLRVKGSARVTGMLYKDGGGFKIDHPLDPENKYLNHSFVESPDMKNVYDGVIELDENGETLIELPDWFEALNRDFRYQLTPIGAPGPNLYIAEEVSDNRFKIAGGDPGMRVSWQVTGIRKDAFAVAHPFVVEEDKPLEERGY